MITFNTLQKSPNKCVQKCDKKKNVDENCTYAVVKLYNFTDTVRHYLKEISRNL